MIRDLQLLTLCLQSPRPQGPLPAAMVAATRPTVVGRGARQSFQCKEKRGDVAAIDRRQVEVRHGVQRIDGLWILQPASHVFRSVGKLAADGGFRRDVIERRPDLSLWPANARNAVTCVAAVLID